MPTTRLNETALPAAPDRAAVLTPFRRRRRHLLLGTAYGVALLAVVLLPIGGALNTLTVRLYVLWTFTLHLPGHPLPETFGSVLNVIMFVPLGYLAVRLTRWHWWQVTLAAVVLSSCFELYQALPIVSRMPSIGDVVTNGLGAAVGALVAAGLARRGRRVVRIPTQRTAARTPTRATRTEPSRTTRGAARHGSTAGGTASPKS